ncbi:MAG: hypothetical protein R2706_19690 [Acidimicrobiales bacterium]
MIELLRRELVGPAPHGDPIDCAAPLRFDTRDQARHPYVQFGSGDEILQRDTPKQRYGVGVLYPLDTVGGDEFLNRGIGEEIEEAVEERDEDEQLPEPDFGGFDAADDDDFDLSTSNTLRPSSMGISFLCRLNPNDRLVVTGSGGRYSPIEVRVAGRDETWWRRSPVWLRAEFTGDSITVPRLSKINLHWQRQRAMRVSTSRSSSLRDRLAPWSLAVSRGCW